MFDRMYYYLIYSPSLKFVKWFIRHAFYEPQGKVFQSLK